MQVLLPVKLVVEALCRSDADLMTAELAFEELFNDLKNMESNIAKDMLAAFENRIKDRWDPASIKCSRCQVDPSWNPLHMTY